MAKNKTEMVSKVTLSTGKVVLLRELKIKHQELAVQAAAPRAGENNVLLNLYTQKELLKILIAQVDGQVVKPSEIEDLDSMFTMAEYGQLVRVMKELMGSDAEMGKFQHELVSFGDK